MNGKEAREIMATTWGEYRPRLPQAEFGTVKAVQDACQYNRIAAFMAFVAVCAPFTGPMAVVAAWYSTRHHDRAGLKVPLATRACFTAGMLATVLTMVVVSLLTLNRV